MIGKVTKQKDYVIRSEGKVICNVPIDVVTEGIRYDRNAKKAEKDLEEPELDEIISHLEWAYWHRDDLKEIGRKASENLSRQTWEESARQFYEIIYNGI